MTAEEALHAYYVENQVSQPEIAERLNVSQGTIHNWLSGKKRIPMERYLMISRLCSVPLSNLLPDSWNLVLSDHVFLDQTEKLRDSR